MKTNTPVVHCVFSPEEPELPALLAESFRLYLCRILASMAQSQPL